MKKKQAKHSALKDEKRRETAGALQAAEEGQYARRADRHDLRGVRITQKKNRWKKIRTVFEVAVLAALAYLLVTSLFNFSTYQPSVASAGADPEQSSFIAVSYFGVEKFDSGSSSLISQSRLAEHLKALSDNGYVTITQQDILEYYRDGKALPEKALFLIFEDGRRDTALFAQKILEKENDIASILTYADRFENDDNKFLTPNNVKTLLKSTYWELGSNGYRLGYINVFDRYGNYFGNLNANEFISVNQYLVRDYNHYLMDFLRDEDRLRAESVEEMRLRIAADYDSMRYVYTKHFGSIPLLYVLMHSNTGKFGTDDLASAQNALYLTDLFAMNFNREGSCLNTRLSSVYDLTRMQPQANWYSNHVLMRIRDDTGVDMDFVVGDTAEAENWTLLSGAAEYRPASLVLTSLPNGYGRIALKNVTFGDGTVKTTLEGNVVGNQGIYLRADEALSQGLYVGIEDNQLVIRQLLSGSAEEIYRLDLFEFDGGSVQSVQENEREGLVALQNALLTYEEDSQALQNAHTALKKLENEKVTTLEEGGEGYVPTLELTDRASRGLEITLSGSSVSVSIDGRAAIRNLQFNAPASGEILLEASSLFQERYSQRNLADDVYDAVFSGLTVTNPKQETPVYIQKLTFWQRLDDVLQNVFENVAAFFVDTF